MKSKLKKHIFVCINCRESDRKSCGDQGLEIRNKLAALSLPIKDKCKVRVNRSGCLDKCEEGPIVVIYPENIWYRGVSIDDCDEIFEKSIIESKVISRLEIKEKDSSKI